jgi:hypothetical protein
MATVDSDLEFGSAGTGNSQFGTINGMAFDASSYLYILDTGNNRVQKFLEGVYVSKFSIGASSTRMAVSAAGECFIVENGYVIEAYSTAGTLAWTRYFGTTLCVAWVPDAGGQVLVLGTATATIRVLNARTGDDVRTITLGVSMTQAAEMVTDAAGNIYVIDTGYILYKFSPSGTLAYKYGGLVASPSDPGHTDVRQILRSVAPDNSGRLWVHTRGSPAKMARVDADNSAMICKALRFAAASDYLGNYVTPALMAVDRSDRLWVTAQIAGGTAKPRIARIATTAYDSYPPTHPAAGGLTVVCSITDPYNIRYNLNAVTVTIAVTATNHTFDLVESVNWTVRDWLGEIVATGSDDVTLAKDVTTNVTFSFTAPAYGSYNVTADVMGGARRIHSASAFLSFVRNDLGMYVLGAGEANVLDADSKTVRWCGQKTLRVSTTGRTPAQVLAVAQQCINDGLLPLISFVDAAECAPAYVTPMVATLKSICTHYVCWNEPELLVSMASYVTTLSAAYDAIHAEQPAAKVMAPNSVTMNAATAQAFIDAGGLAKTDIYNFHSYEGHEHVNPPYYRAQVAAIATKLTTAGRSDLIATLFMGERGVLSKRVDATTFASQAVRAVLHHNAMDLAGVPNTRLFYYYISDQGFYDYASFVRAASDLYPAALALRHREAMIGAMTKESNLSFGTPGDSIVIGMVHVKSADNTRVVTIQNCGCRRLAITLTLGGTVPPATLSVSDAWGNDSTVTVGGGTVSLMVGLMPTYVRLPAGVTATAVAMDWGTNKALTATASTDIAGASNVARANDGIFETPYTTDPNSDDYFIGGASDLPKSYTLSWAASQTFSKVVIWGNPPDNAQCGLLAYDLEYSNDGGTTWTMIEEVDLPVGPTWPADTTFANVMDAQPDYNMAVHSFTSVTANRLRITARRVTFGAYMDAIHMRYTDVDVYSSFFPALLQLREVQVFA